MAYFSEAEGLSALTLTSWPGSMTYANIQPIIDEFTNGLLPYDAAATTQKSMSCFLLKEWVAERQNPQYHSVWLDRAASGLCNGTAPLRGG